MQKLLVHFMIDLHTTYHTNSKTGSLVITIRWKAK